MRAISRLGAVLTILLAAFLTKPAHAQSCDEGRVRLHLADLAAGAPVAVLKSAVGDPNAVEALVRWEAGVRPYTPDRFARKLQYGQGWTLVLSGTRALADGSEVRLTTDGRPMSEGEGRVRLLQLKLALGFPLPTTAPEASDLALARRRSESGIRVTNTALFQKLSPGKMARRGSEKPVAGWQVRLSSDPGAQCYAEAQVRRILADIALGGPLDYYETHRDEPGVAEALRRRDRGVRVLNLARFERNIVEDKGWQVVHKRSHVPIEGTEVELSAF